MEQSNSMNGMANNVSSKMNIPKTKGDGNSEKSTKNDSFILSEEPIRIGYIVECARENSIFHMMLSIPNFHDRNKVEVFHYYVGSEETRSMAESYWFSVFSNKEHYRNITGTFEDAKRIIEADDIQILVQFNSTTNSTSYSILNTRITPIQIVLLLEPIDVNTRFWTYEYTDYFITDSITQPLTERHSEKIVHMKRSVFMSNHQQMYSNLKRPVKFVSEEDTFKCTSVIQPDETLKCYYRKMFNLPENDIVFCNFGEINQIARCMILLDAWSEILHNVPNSVLWFVRDPVDSEDRKYDDDFHTIQHFFCLKGIISSRIIISDFMSRDEHIAGRVPLADIFLDLSFQFSNHASCLDAIWAGIPVVTLPSKCETSRVAASVLTSINCEDTIAKNIENYIEIATDLGLDENKLKDIQLKIWNSRIKYRLFDRKLYARELETIYERVWGKILE